MTTSASESTATAFRHTDRPAPWREGELESRLRELAQSRYHDRHPFNRRMHEGELSPDELRGWVANRFYYQCNIPVKDALILAKLPTPAQRRSWLRRIQDHDGLVEGEGGIERWLRLGEAVGLSRDELLRHERLLPGVRLAVDGYVNFCRNGSALEAVASSLTELCAPSIMLTRLERFPVHYPWIDSAGLSYFRSRVPQGRRDGTEALTWVKEWAVTRSRQERALSALSFKCDVLWTLLDSVEGAGVRRAPR
ncbi:pyrroloquinoline-quinone synthase PqqC [Streptomyces sp. NPDC060027]|uniref:pyrroloquinoline-quinone synthase PqqC n=1 Tax=Streptomyces sp. NPDC060027 TaxID=3347040 RepID=UPI0036810022